jgi:hypothetical protein
MNLISDTESPGVITLDILPVEVGEEMSGLFTALFPIHPNLDELKVHVRVEIVVSYVACRFYPVL